MNIIQIIKPHTSEIDIIYSRDMGRFYLPRYLYNTASQQAITIAHNTFIRTYEYSKITRRLEGQSRI